MKIKTNIIKKIVTITFFCFIITNLSFAQNSKPEIFNIKEKNYTIEVKYDKNSYPGEAFFVKMKIKTKGKLSIKDNFSATATLVGKKNISKADFYIIPRDVSSNKFADLLVALPMWSWQPVEKDVKILVTIKFDETTTKSFELPVIINNKEYLKERIALDQNLTNLISKPSPEKKEQSRILNQIIQTTNNDAVYEFSGFIRPTTGTRITSEFGQTRTFVYNNGKESPSYHAGLDFGIPTGTQIVACGKGKVVMATWRIVTGYSVIIEHLPGLYSIYYHLSELKCAEGDIVEKGQLIALSGATGLATGPHLHWEIRLNTFCLEPDSFIKDFAFEEDSPKSVENEK